MWGRTSRKPGGTRRRLGGERKEIIMLFKFINLCKQESIAESEAEGTPTPPSTAYI